MKGRDGLDVKCVIETVREGSEGERERQCVTGNNGVISRRCEWVRARESM